MRKQSSFDDEVTSLSSAAMHLPKKCSYQTSTQLNAFYSPCADAACLPEADVIFSQ